jgi:hypothetical protein
VRIISIAAPGNGSGKTSVIAGILAAHPGRLTAVKFTTVFRDGINCPRTERACACRELHGRYTVVTDPQVLATEDTDTGRLTRAGARAVLWCLARVGAHEEAWAHLKAALVPEDADLITEGNTVVPHLRPDLLVMVASPRLPRGRWKPDAWDLMRRADHVVVNPHGAGAEGAAVLAEEIAAARGGRQPSIEDVSRPLARWRDASVRDAIARLLAAPREARPARS